MNRLERAWAATILFMNGWNFALPVTDTPLPIVFTPVQVVRGVFIHEILFIGYVGYVFIVRAGYVRLPGPRAWRIGLLIAGLGALAILSAGTNARPVTEIFSGVRYFVLAAYFLFAAYWARRYRPVFVLRTFLLGILSAGSVTLYYTFTTASTLLGGLPMLKGQSGPGGYLGLAVILSAWLVVLRRTVLDTAIAVAVAIIGVLAVSISFSKLAMLMATWGVIAWFVVLLNELGSRRARRVYAFALVGLAAILGMEWHLAGRYVRGVQAFVHQKFVNYDPESIATRFQFFLITSEIVTRHPLFGVGYGGFYEGETETDAYKGEWAGKVEPEPELRAALHPESSFLYHASATGLPGLLLVVCLFLVSLGVLKRALVPQGFAGKAVWACLVFGYWIFGLTLPTLFNTSVLYLPVAVGLCGYARGIQNRSRKVWSGSADIA